MCIRDRVKTENSLRSFNEGSFHLSYSKLNVNSRYSINKNCANQSWPALTLPLPVGYPLLQRNITSVFFLLIFISHSCSFPVESRLFCNSCSLHTEVKFPHIRVNFSFQTILCMPIKQQIFSFFTELCTGLHKCYYRNYL